MAEQLKETEFLDIKHEVVQRELERRSFERYSVPFANRCHPDSPVDDFLGCCHVIKGNSRLGISQQAAVKDTAQNDRNAPFDTFRQEFGQCRLVQQ